VKVSLLYESIPLITKRRNNTGAEQLPLVSVYGGQVFLSRPAEYTIYDVIDLTLSTDSFQAFAVWGFRSAGKSTCALWLGHYIFRKLYPDESEDEIWNMVLDHTIFNIREFDMVVKRYEEEFWDEKLGFKGYYDHRYRVPWIYWDDAGLHGSRYYWYETSMKHFASLLDIIRVYVKIFMYSCPFVSRVIKGMREEFITGEIHIPMQAVILPTGELKQVYGQAWFIHYQCVPDFYRPAREYILKRFVNTFHRAFTFPKLPEDVERRYNMRKQQAIEDLKTRRKELMLRKKDVLKQIEETLMPMEKSLLIFLADRGDDWMNIYTIAEEFGKQMKLGRKIGMSELRMWLRALRANNLVQSADFDTWRITEEGLMVVDIWRAKESGELQDEDKDGE
jgi:hypothetical protein